MGTLLITIEKLDDGFAVKRQTENMSPYEIIGACEETIRDIRKQIDKPNSYKTTKRTRITPKDEIEIEDLSDFPSD